MTRSLDEQIIDASGLVSMLLVFVFAYGSALLPLVEELRHRPKPAAVDDQVDLRRRLSTYVAIACALLVVIVTVLALLGPLSWRVLHAELWRPFRTLRLGLLLLDLLLVATGVAVATEALLMSQRRRELK